MSVSQVEPNSVRGLREIIVNKISLYRSTGEVEVLASLDAIYQLSQILISNEYIVSNIGARYGINGNKVLAKTISDLLDAGISNVKVEGLYEAAKYYIAKFCSPDFKYWIKESVRRMSNPSKDIVRIIAKHYLYGYLRGAYDPRGLLWALRWAFNVAEDEIKAVAAKLGINQYWYESRRFSHLAWEAPEYWSGTTLVEICSCPEEYNMPKIDVYTTLAPIISDPPAREIVEWLRAKKSAFIGVSEMSSFKKDMDKKYGEHAFERTIGKLVRGEALIIGSFDDYRHEHYIVLSPEAIEML